MLHLITTLDRGGAEKALLALARGQRERGWTVDVGYLKGPGELTHEFEAEGVDVTALHAGALAGVGAYGRARRLVRSLRPDVVHTHLFKADTLGAAVVGRGAGHPALVSTKHNEDAYLSGAGARAGTNRAVARRVLARADAWIAITEGVHEFFRRTLGEAIPQAAVIPYGVSVPDEPPDRDAARARLGIDPSVELVVCAARFEPQKDHATLLTAVHELRRRRPAAHLALLGRGSTEDDVRRRADGLPVTFAGFVDDPTDWFAAADVVALASHHEGLGRVLLEAAALGRPCVATAVGGVPEVIETPSTGRLVPPSDWAAFAAALAEVLRELRDDPAARGRFAQACRALVRSRFSHAASVERTLEVYARCLRPRP